MSDLGKQHRVIGIRHVLRKMKDAGLVEEETLYADQAVADVQTDLLRKAGAWYNVGARRGALEVLDALLDGRIELKRNKDGSKEVVANVGAITWKKRLNVIVGTRKIAVPSRTYKLNVKDDLDFE